MIILYLKQVWCQLSSIFRYPTWIQSRSGLINGIWLYSLIDGFRLKYTCCSRALVEGQVGWYFTTPWCPVSWLPHIIMPLLSAWSVRLCTYRNPPILAACASKALVRSWQLLEYSYNIWVDRDTDKLAYIPECKFRLLRNVIQEIIGGRSKHGVGSLQ